MKKEELLKLVKELATKEDLSKDGYNINELRKEEERISRRDAETLADKSYEEEFIKNYKIVASKISSLAETTYEAKKEIIEKAKNVLKESNYKKATNEMNALFIELKNFARCSKEQDDALWAEFNEIRKTFNQNKDAYYANIKQEFENKKKAKEEIVNKAKEAINNENIKETNNLFNSLLEDWKKVGFAGKEVDDALWKEFSNARKEFNAKKDAYYDSLKETFKENASKKEEIIKKAKLCLANSSFTKEETEQVKALREEWKKVGNAGKEKDNELYKEFNEIINKYFDELRFYIKNN